MKTLFWLNYISFLEYSEWNELRYYFILYFWKIKIIGIIIVIDKKTHLLKGTELC